MKQFFKFMFATVAGIILTFFLIGFFGMLLVVFSRSSIEKNRDKEDISANSVLHLKLNEPMRDLPSSSPLDNFDFESFEIKKHPAFHQLISSIEFAKTDDRIKGIYLDVSGMPIGMAQVEEIRNALLDFKESGKWTVSYSEVYTQKSYYLATIADEIYLNPSGMMELRGLASEVMFFKRALEKLDVEAQIIRHGKFKSAVEPFMLEKMSESNRLQQSKIIHSIWGSMINSIGSSREITTEEINALADSIKVRKAVDAVKYKLVDKLIYKDELLASLRNKLGLEEDGDIEVVSLSGYAREIRKKIDKGPSDKRVAVIYAEGEIVSGKNQDGKMGSETIAKAIREARTDEDVKAIVLRVNSPGGSALASDVMWREVVLAKKQKPFVVSMGNVAASGGYYISCAADKIFASEKTITGSIGVFGMIPNMQGLMKNKLGVDVDVVKTNDHADIVTVTRPLSAGEKQIIQHEVENVYDDFITKVSEGRGISKDMVDSIGQGRVWTGQDALAIKLVDEIGGLDVAIIDAAKKAELENYKVVTYPKKKQNPFEMFVSMQASMSEKILQKRLGVHYDLYKRMEAVTQQQTGILMQMPYTYDIY